MPKPAYAMTSTIECFACPNLLTIELKRSEAQRMGKLIDAAILKARWKPVSYGSLVVGNVCPDCIAAVVDDDEPPAVEDQVHGSEGEHADVIIE